MPPTLTPIQCKAYDLALQTSEKATHIAGYAGTGKTTVMAAVAEQLHNNCVVLAPTNKAAENLRNKGINRARTIHSCLYQPSKADIKKKNKKTGETEYHKDPVTGEFLRDTAGELIPVLVESRMSFSLREDQSELPPIALVDETSMVSEEVYNDILKSFDKVIFFGDPFQLPPVAGRDVFKEANIDIFFEEIHRVASENPIIRYATELRQGKNPHPEDIKCHEIGFCGENNSKLIDAIINNKCQVICGRNYTRHRMNNRIRELGHKLEPFTLQEGEPIVALKNIRQWIGDKKELLFYNGQILSSGGTYQSNDDFLEPIKVKIKDEGHHYLWPFWDKGFFDLYDNKPKWDNERQRRKADPNKFGSPAGCDFDYAYALTVHKAQGSEFDNVVIYDERDMWKGDRQLAQRWYYTGVTRAKERILVVNK